MLGELCDGANACPLEDSELERALRWRQAASWAAQSVMAPSRTLEEDLEMLVGTSMPDRSPLLAWLIEYAAVL